MWTLMVVFPSPVIDYQLCLHLVVKELPVQAAISEEVVVALHKRILPWTSWLDVHHADTVLGYPVFYSPGNKFTAVV